MLCLCVIFTMVGCGSKNDSAKGKIEISVLARGGADKGTIQKLIEDFNKTNEHNIYIKYEEKDDSISEYIRVALQAGTAPDIIEGMSESTMDMALKKNWLRPLDDDMVEKYRNELSDGSIAKAADGKIYTVGMARGGTCRLIYNKEMFEEYGLEVPTTWDQVRENAKIITSKGEGKKYGFAIPFKNEGFGRWYVMIAGAPSDMYNNDGFDNATGKFDFTIYEDMVQMLKNLVDDGSTFPSPTTLDNDTARAQFAAGNIGMMLGMRWDVGVFNNQFPCTMDWGAVNIPTFTGEITGSYPGGTGGTGGKYMTANSKHPKEQLIVWEYLHGKEYAKAMQDAGVIVSTYKDIGNVKAIDSDLKCYTELNIPDEGLRIHYLDHPAKPNPAVQGDNYEKAFTAMVMGQIDIKKGLKDLTDRYNAGLAEWEKKGNDLSDYIVKDWDPNTYIPE